VQTGTPKDSSISMDHDSSASNELSTATVEMPWLYVLCVGWFAAFFMYFSYVPIWHTDIWGHVAYGQWMMEHGRLPDVDPFVELARTTPLVASAWLSQLIFGLLERSGGPERISCAFAVISISIYLTLTWLFLLKTNRIGLAVLCSILTWLIGWDRHLVIRPELLGYLSFALLLVLLSVARVSGFYAQFPVTEEPPEVSPIRRWGIRGALAMLFAVWANLHGSFAVGLVALGTLVVGAFVETWWRSRSFRQPFIEPANFELLVLLGIATVATCVNPYGIRLPIYVATFGTHPNMATISEWQAPELTSVNGIIVAAVSVVFLLTLKVRQARPTISEWLLLAVFTAAVCQKERMISWYAPIAGLSLLPAMLGMLVRTDRQPWMQRIQAILDGRSRVQSGLIVLFVWLAFCFSPISQPVLGGRVRPPEKLFRDRTPLGITRFLRETEPSGRVANPQWWGDWLCWAGPQGLQVMMTTNSLHLVPSQHYENYMAICWGKPGLQERLDKYEIETLVVDTSLQKELTRYVRESTNWEITYQDFQGFVARRKGVR
jgi:hypothetical protein